MGDAVVSGIAAIASRRFFVIPKSRIPQNDTRVGRLDIRLVTGIVKARFSERKGRDAAQNDIVWGRASGRIAFEALIRWQMVALEGRGSVRCAKQRFPGRKLRTMGVFVRN